MLEIPVQRSIYICVLYMFVIIYVCLYNASFLPLISANAFYFHALSLFIDT